MPIGPCSFISPFNFPLNLAAHKIAPAIAVGCPFVMKPASRTPLGAIIMGEVLAETDLPKGAFSILPAHREGADLFTDRRAAEAAELHRLARGRLGPQGQGRQEEGRARARRQCRGDRRPGRRPRRRGRADHLRRLLPVGPELHRRAAHPDPRRRSTTSSATCWSRRPRRWSPAIRKDRNTFIGPMIDAKARRSGSTTGSRRRSAKGATLLCGGKRDGAMLEATLLEDVDRDDQAQSRGGVRAGRLPDPASATSTPRSTTSTTASSASRPASSPATSSRCSTPGTGSRSAAS